MSGSFHKYGYIRLTEGVRAELRRKLLATRLPPRKLLSRQEQTPDGLDVAFLTDILNGNLDSVSRDIYNYIDTICAKISDDLKFEKQRKKTVEKQRRKIVSEKRFIEMKEHVDISYSKREEILNEVSRTGYSIKGIIQEAGREDLDYSSLYRVSKNSQATAKLKDVDSLLELYAQKGSLGGGAARKKTLAPGYKPITQDDIDVIKAEIHRTNVRPVRLDTIAKLSTKSYTIVSWISGVTKSHSLNI